MQDANRVLKKDERGFIPLKIASVLLLFMLMLPLAVRAEYLPLGENWYDIPEPRGFVRIIQVKDRNYATTRLAELDGCQTISLYVPPDHLTTLENRNIILPQRYFALYFPEEGNSQKFNQKQFAELKKTLIKLTRMRSGDVSGNVLLPQNRDEETNFSLRVFPPHLRFPNMIAYSSVIKYSGPLEKTRVDTWLLLHREQQVWVFNCSGGTKDLGWTRRAVLGWAWNVIQKNLPGDQEENRILKMSLSIHLIIFLILMLVATIIPWISKIIEKKKSQ